jgi:HSP20 family protein
VPAYLRQHHREKERSMPLPVRRREATRNRDMMHGSQRRWDPFRELQEIQQQTEQLLESAFTDAAAELPWVPLVDIEETDDAWIFEAELPGAKADDIEVELRDAELVITGEIKERDRTGILRRRTRRVGRFEFRVTLPGDADAEHLEAHLDGGVLTVRVPKAEQARARRIEIQSGEGSEGS